jgi:prepilin-type N-terminal cleavage/methylation domain-containing protein
VGARAVVRAQLSQEVSFVKEMMKLRPQSRPSRAARNRLVAFTLVEVIVALAIILILAAVALPNLTGYLDQKRIDETVVQMTRVRNALFDGTPGANAFFQKVTSNAGRLSELDSVITITKAFTPNSCGNAFTAAQRTNWINNGPFLNFDIDRTSGMQTPIGRADDIMVRIPAGGGGAFGFLQINFTNAVTQVDAIALDSTADAGNGSAAGFIQWTAPVGGMVTLRYFVTINTIC